MLLKSKNHEFCEIHGTTCESTYDLIDVSTSIYDKKNRCLVIRHYDILRSLSLVQSLMTKWVNLAGTNAYETLVFIPVKI